MSKTSYVLIGIMVAAIAFMAALRGYRAYEAYAARQEAENVSVFTFQNVPVNLGLRQAEPVSKPVKPDAVQTDIFLMDEPLPPAKQEEQAAKTVESILSDYEGDDALRSFNRDLAAATDGRVTSLTDLSGAELAAVMQEYPQISDVIRKNLQNPQFASVIQSIFTNPQFAHSISVLQGGGAQIHSAPADKKNE